MLVNPLDAAVSSIVNKIGELKKQLAADTKLFDKLYKVTESHGNKKFVATQSDQTMEWRQEVKKLLREYLKLKFSDDASDGAAESKAIESHSEILKFRIKTEGGSSLWYELSKDNRGEYTKLSRGSGVQKKETQLSEQERLIFQKGVLTRIFKGSHLEEINLRTVKKEPDAHWSGWRTKLGYSSWVSRLPLLFQDMVFDVGERFYPLTIYWKTYQETIHPSIAETSLGVLNSCSATPNIVELCGGGGELAIQVAECYSKPMNYYLLECNDRSLEQARRSAFSVNENGIHIVPIRANVTCNDDYCSDAEKQNRIEDRSIDLIIGSGALMAGVLESREAALKVAKKCYELLRAGGKMILAGHAHSLLNRDDFESIGYQVINSYLVGMNNSPFITEISTGSAAYRVQIPLSYHFYILEK